jgi:hypothetical protein
MYLARTWTLDIRRLAESWKCDEFEDRPMVRTSPFSVSSTDGTADSGARSDVVLVKAGRRRGELERMPVVDVGIGVGYLT